MVERDWEEEYRGRRALVWQWPPYGREGGPEGPKTFSSKALVAETSSTEPHSPSSLGVSYTDTNSVGLCSSRCITR